MPDDELALIDAHCHLDEVARRGVALTDVLERAHRLGIHQIVTSGDGLRDSRDAADLADRHEEVYFTVGWHPVNPRPPDDREVEELLELLRHPKAVAVGEIGLDYLMRPGHLETPAEVQRVVFAEMLAMAAQVGKPAVIHQRQAEADLLAVIDQAPPVAGMLHCFSGGAQMVGEALERGLLCSFAGNVTFRSAATLQAAVREVTAESLLLETDAPFLAPVPHRGSVCEPAMVRATATLVAALRGECLETLARVTTANSRRFFGLPSA